jgi:membrane-anchored protein YejM (alkaline phosphatase superfamily)
LPGHSNEKIIAQCSQIDFFPTLFGYFNWSYESKYYGKDVNLFSDGEERALIGNYRKLALLKDRSLSVLSEKQVARCYDWDKTSNDLQPIPDNQVMNQETITYYQTIDHLYRNGLLKSNLSN